MTTMTRSEESTATTAVPRHAAQNDPAVGGPRLILEVLSPSRPANVAYRPAYDPDTRLLYVSSITAPFVADLLPGDPARTNFKYVPGLRAYPPGPQGLPLLKPPYGRITAIDLNQGSIRWVVPHGNGPREHPLLKPLNLPPLGNPGRGGLFATKTLLFVGEGDPVMVRAGSRLPPGMPLSIAPGAGGRMFRAFDKSTGAVDDRHARHIGSSRMVVGVARPRVPSTRRRTSVGRHHKCNAL